MAWTDEQKRLGRLELQKRSSPEFARSRRGAFLKAGAAAIGAALLSCLFLWSAFRGTGTRLRLEAAISALITLTGALISSGLAYVRFRDWQRGDR